MLKVRESTDICKMDYLSNVVLDATKMKMVGCARLKKSGRGDWVY